MKKCNRRILSGVKRGTKGETEEICFMMHFCVHEANLFFHFGINIGFVIAKEEFEKDFLLQRN
jgi:hypothetical protein